MSEQPTQPEQPTTNVAGTSDRGLPYVYQGEMQDWTPAQPPDFVFGGEGTPEHCDVFAPGLHRTLEGAKAEIQERMDRQRGWSLIDPDDPDVEDKRWIDWNAASVASEGYRSWRRDVKCWGTVVFQIVKEKVIEP